MHERLDFYGDGKQLDFVIVAAPSASRYSLVYGYWQEFQSVIGELPREHWQDQILFERYALYYRKLGRLLHPAVLVDLLLPASRHQFYVTKGVHPVGDRQVMRLSGIERLLGYEEISSDVISGGGSEAVGTGRPDLDVIASLIRLEVSELEWLCANYSIPALAAVAEYLWECKAAAAGQTTESQHRKDFELWERVKRAQGERIDAAADEAIGWLLNRTGKQAIELNTIRQQDGNS